MVSNDQVYNVNGIYICRKKKASSSDAGFCWRNSQTAEEGKEIVEAVTLPDCKDDVETTMVSLTRLACLPTMRHTALSTSLRWLEAQDDCDSVRLELVDRLQQNAAMKQSTKLMQRRVTGFFVN